MTRRSSLLLALAASVVLHGPASGDGVADDAPDDTVLVLDVVPGADTSYVETAVTAGSVAWYPEYGPASAHLVRTDGRTTAIVSGVSATAWHVTRGSDLWCVTQGVGQHSDLVRVAGGDIEGGGVTAEIVAGPAQGFAGVSAGPVVVGDHVVFVADGGADGFEPWAADADTLVTTQLAVTAQHPRAFLQGPILAAAGRAVFWVYDPPLDWVPPSTPNPDPSDPSGGTLTMWVTDGTPEGTHAVAGEPVAAYRHDMLTPRASAAGLVWFTRTSELGATALWRTDGTAEGTLAVTNAGTESGFGAFAAVGDRTAFLWQTSQALVLAVSDGTREGTAAVPGAPQFPQSAVATAVSGSRLFLGAYDTVGSSDLSQQPRPVTARAGDPPTRPSGLSVVDGRALFVASDVVHGPAVWTTDGSTSGTRRLRDGLELEVPTVGENFTFGFTPVGDRILFSAWDAAHGWEMRSIPRAWATDPLPPLAPDPTTEPPGEPPVELPDVAPSGRILRLRAHLTRSGGDAVLTLRGAVRLTRGSTLGGDRVIVGAGNFVRAFATDASGAASDARGAFRTIGRPRPGRTAAFVVTLLGDDADEAVAGTSRTLRVAVWFDGALRAANVRRPH